MGILRAGFLVNVLTKPIISGFTSAAALIIAANQISNLSGIPIERNTQIQYIAIEGVKYLNQFNKPTLIIGLSTISLITILSKIKFKIKIPIALITLVLGIICVNRFNLQTEGVKIVGTIPSGLPSFKTPLDHIGNAVKLIPIAFTLALVAFMEAFSVSNQCLPSLFFSVALSYDKKQF